MTGRVAELAPSDLRKVRIRRLVLGYPLALIAAATLANYLLLGVAPLTVAPPSPAVITALAICGALLLLNHTWLMISTELTRLSHDLSATPEEWRHSGRSRADASRQGEEDLERRHNAHRNTTENVVYFAILALPFAFASPPPLTALVWIISFGAARLGYTYRYLTANTAGRGVFMSASLLALYGMAGYLVLTVAYL